MSSELMDQSFPPKERETETEVLHAVYYINVMRTGNDYQYLRNEYMPAYWPFKGAEPGTFDQISWVTVVGAPMRVVPVSMAARPSLLEIEIALPWTVTAGQGQGQDG